MSSFHTWGTSTVCNRIRSRPVRVRPFRLASLSIARISRSRWVTFWMPYVIAERQPNAWCVDTSMDDCYHFFRCHRMTIHCHSHADHPASVFVPFFIVMIRILATHFDSIQNETLENNDSGEVQFSSSKRIFPHIISVFSSRSNQSADSNPTFFWEWLQCYGIKCAVVKVQCEYKRTNKNGKQRKYQNVDQFIVVTITR